MSVKTKKIFPFGKIFFVFTAKCGGKKGAGKFFPRNVIIFVDIFGTLMI